MLHFPNSPIFKRKVVVTGLCLAKHILGLGLGNDQNIFRNLWNILGDLRTSVHMVGSSSKILSKKYLIQMSHV